MLGKRYSTSSSFVVVGECQDKQSFSAENALMRTAKEWRQNHSSLLMKESKYKVSQSVNETLYPTKPQPYAVHVHISQSLYVFKASKSTKDKMDVDGGSGVT